jgi:hypothetical protein
VSSTHCSDPARTSAVHTATATVNSSSRRRGAVAQAASSHCCPQRHTVTQHANHRAMHTALRDTQRSTVHTLACGMHCTRSPVSQPLSNLSAPFNIAFSFASSATHGTHTCNAVPPLSAHHTPTTPSPRPLSAFSDPAYATHDTVATCNALHPRSSLSTGAHHALHCAPTLTPTQRPRPLQHPPSPALRLNLTAYSAFITSTDGRVHRASPQKPRVADQVCPSLAGADHKPRAELQS